MTRDEHNAAIESILGMINPEHQAAASEALNNLRTDYDDTLTQLETANANVTNLTQRNEHLREVNADLFTQIPARKKQEQEKKQNEPTKPALSFEALFDEKGDIK